MCGPAFLHLVDDARPAARPRRACRAVPLVATSSNPSAASWRHGSTSAALSPSRTETKTQPVERQVGAAAELRLGEGAAEIGVEPHDLAGRVHLRAEDQIDAGEAGEREHRLLDRDMARGCSARGASRRQQIRQLLAGHDPRRDLGDRHAGRLGDERHGARGARVDLEDVDLAVLDRELHVHQPDDVERAGQRDRSAARSRRSSRGRGCRAAASRRCRRNGCRPPRYAP